MAADLNHPTTLEQILEKKPKFVLIVDDEPMIATLLRPVLKENGYDVEAVKSGGECLDYLGVRRPDIIILDIDMPDIDGIETCKKIRADARGNKVPIVFLTGLKTKEKFKAAMAAGGNDFIVKPFEAATVLARIRKHLPRAGAWGAKG